MSLGSADISPSPPRRASRQAVGSVEDRGFDGSVRGAPHLQHQIELEPSPLRVLRPELRHLDLLRSDGIRGHVNVLAQVREQAGNEILVAEMNSHVPQGTTLRPLRA